MQAEELYSGVARNSQELDDCLALAAGVFRRLEQSQIALENKAKLMFQSPGQQLSNAICLVEKGGRVVGTCFLVEREFYASKGLISGTFLTSICIDEAERGKGLSALLMETAINTARERGASFVVVIARRDVDHYYNRFGFWGISQYSKISISAQQLLELPDDKCFNTVSVVVRAQDFAELDGLYGNAYETSYGACARSAEYWRHLSWKTKLMELTVNSFHLKGTLVGYLVQNKNVIHEIAAVGKSTYHGILKASLKDSVPDKPMAVECGLNHPVVASLSDLDFTHHVRSCTYGGHMAKVLDPHKIAECLGAAGSEVEEVNDQLRPELARTLRQMCARSIAIANKGSNDLNSFNIPLLDQC